MTRDEVMAKLRAHETELRAAGVEALWLFGSFARDEAGEGSDVDLLYAGALRYPMSPLGQDQFRECVQGIVDRKVDLVTREGMMPRMRARVEATLVQIF